MATTTPDNIYSPDPNTLYNFVTDLRNMAVSIQTALSRRVSGLRGTTAERNAALSSTPIEATWFDTTTNLWYVRGTSAWVEAGPNSFRGPTASMNAYPNPKMGMEWWDSSTGNRMWRTTTAWRPHGSVSNQAERDSVVSNPVQGSNVFRIDLGYTETYYEAYNASSNPAGKTPAGWYADAQRTLRGNVTFPPLNAGAASGRITVNFPAGYFQQPPHFIVNDSYSGGRRTPYSLSVTTTSASFNLANLTTGSETNSSTIPWIAIP